MVSQIKKVKKKEAKNFKGFWFVVKPRKKRKKECYVELCNGKNTLERLNCKNKREEVFERVEVMIGYHKAIRGMK